MSDDFQNEIRFLGIVSSPAFVREPEGNGCIERFFKTLREQQAGSTTSNRYRNWFTPSKTSTSSTTNNASLSASTFSFPFRPGIVLRSTRQLDYGQLCSRNEGRCTNQNGSQKRKRGRYPPF